MFIAGFQVLTDNTITLLHTKMKTMFIQGVRIFLCHLYWVGCKFLPKGHKTGPGARYWARIRPYVHFPTGDGLIQRALGTENQNGVSASRANTDGQVDSAWSFARDFTLLSNVSDQFK